MHTPSTSLFKEKNQALYERAEALLTAQKTIKQISELILKENNFTEDEIGLIIRHLKKIQHEKDHKIGRLLLLIGAALLFCGFAVTLYNIYTNQSVHLVMYGLTSAGLVVMFVGLYFVFN